MNHGGRENPKISNCIANSAFEIRRRSNTPTTWLGENRNEYILTGGKDSGGKRNAEMNVKIARVRQWSLGDQKIVMSRQISTYRIAS